MFCKTIFKLDRCTNMLCFQSISSLIIKCFFIGFIIDFYSCYRYMKAIMYIKCYSASSTSKIYNFITFIKFIILKKSSKSLIWCCFITVIMNLIVFPLSYTYRSNTKQFIFYYSYIYITIYRPTVCRFCISILWFLINVNTKI